MKVQVDTPCTLEATCEEVGQALADDLALSLVPFPPVVEQVLTAQVFSLEQLEQHGADGYLAARAVFCAVQKDRPLLQVNLVTAQGEHLRQAHGRLQSHVKEQRLVFAYKNLTNRRLLTGLKPTTALTLP